MAANAPEITPRNNLEFGLDGDIPRYWFGGDPFKTRLFDAMSTLFPEGEKFFIQCVRDYRDRITDPELSRQTKDFMRQEGQHGMVHDRFNDRLRRQGINVDNIEEGSRKMFAFFRSRFSRGRTLAQTAAAEHMTAIMAHSFFDRQDVFHDADPRIRAIYAWHGVEEIEHKAVAFDVMQKVAGVGYLLRCWVMLVVSVMFPFHVFMVMRHMFRVDGIRGWARTRMWLRGLWWMYGPGGLFLPVLPHYLTYYKPGFHPWKEGCMDTYRRWVTAFDESGDPVAAGDVLMASV